MVRDVGRDFFVQFRPGKFHQETAGPLSGLPLIKDAALRAGSKGWDLIYCRFVERTMQILRGGHPQEKLLRSFLASNRCWKQAGIWKKRNSDPAVQPLNYANFA